jgi:hypothetical protein
MRKWKDSPVVNNPNNTIASNEQAESDKRPAAQPMTAPEIEELRAMIAALENPELPFLYASGSREGAQRCAQRLRRFLPPTLH